MWGMKNYYLGHVSKTNPFQLEKIFVDQPCSDCDILGVCGGRCLYANITKRWSSEAYATVCSTVRGLVDAVETELPRIKELINDEKVSLRDFEFMKYNGCEIIP
jgi:sulfatase maturation enzyme AslB (radical SAM superfamily)